MSVIWASVSYDYEINDRRLGEISQSPELISVTLSSRLLEVM